MGIGASTRLLAVLGDPIAHSLSPTMHNAAFAALGLDAVYVAFRTPAPALGAVLDALAAVGGAGNITVPHKEAAERAITRKTELCTRVGACNTFWTENGDLVGDNTDVAGVRAALAELDVPVTPGAGGRWLVIGTGGAARAVAVVAAEARIELSVRSRDATRAQEFVAWAKTTASSAQVARPPYLQDVIINTTPLGLDQHDPLPLEPAAIPEAKVVLDLVYGAGETAWVRALRAAGARAADGRAMLAHQGAAAFARWFPDQAAPVAVMRAAVDRALGRALGA
jgi:shikimate dehydrogenase